MDIHGLNFTLGEDVNGPLLAAALAVEMIAALIIGLAQLCVGED